MALIPEAKRELERAKEETPSWDTILEEVTALNPKAGEAFKLASKMKVGEINSEADAMRKNLRLELIQTTAMCFRLWEELGFGEVDGEPTYLVTGPITLKEGETVKECLEKDSAPKAVVEEPLIPQHMLDEAIEKGKDPKNTAPCTFIGDDGVVRVIKGIYRPFPPGYEPKDHPFTRVQDVYTKNPQPHPYIRNLRDVEARRELTLKLECKTKALSAIAHYLGCDVGDILTRISELKSAQCPQPHPYIRNTELKNCRIAEDVEEVPLTATKIEENYRAYIRNLGEGPNYAELAAEIGKLVEEKQAAYGDSFGKSGEVLKVLYPNGIQPEQYADMMAVTRILDKLFRIATDKNALGESPYKDIVGYGLLGVTRTVKESLTVDNVVQHAKDHDLDLGELVKKINPAAAAIRMKINESGEVEIENISPKDFYADPWVEDENHITIDGVRYKAVEGTDCTKCAFRENPDCDGVTCFEYSRADKRNVVWKRVE